MHDIFQLWENRHTQVKEQLTQQPISTVQEGQGHERQGKTKKLSQTRGDEEAVTNSVWDSGGIMAQKKGKELRHSNKVRVWLIILFQF